MSRDLHRLLLAAEAGQKADILTYSSGHLGPRSLNQSQPQRETNKPFWKKSQSLEQTPNLLTLQQTREKALNYVKKKEIKECSSELFTGSAALAESEVSRSRQDQTADCPTHEDTSLSEVVYCSSDSLLVQPSTSAQCKALSSSDLEWKQYSDQEDLNNEGQLKMKQRFGRQFQAEQNLWAEKSVAERHERKLEKALRRLSVQSWPSRDRLAVFSDVFDDVCEGSPVFGRILREIKTDYDLYVNHMMASQSSLQDTALDTSLEDLGNDKVQQMELEDAEHEVYRLEQEARRALEENIRVQNESQNVPAIKGPEDSDMKNTLLSGLQDGGTATDHVQYKRLQVLNMWREIQQVEQEIKEKLVSTVTITATERRIKDLKTEIIRLIASNDRLKTTNKDLENNINMVLNREKATKAIRRMLWEEIHSDLQTESEQLQQQNFS